MKLDRFENSLEVVNNKIYSFNKLVAIIDGDCIEFKKDIKIDKISIKHVKYAAEYLGKKIKNY